MPKIRFHNNKFPAFEVGPGSNLMKSLLEKQIPVASSCGGKAVCGKCRINVLQGMQNLSAANEDEHFLQEKYEVKAHQRISCQTLVEGDVEIDTSYW